MKKPSFRLLVLIAVATIVIAISSKPRADSGVCGGASLAVPFTDVAGNFFFCQIAAVFFSGLTSGTTPTTYSPDSNVTRDQMAAFTTRTLDQSLKRGSRRAALNQYWATTPRYDIGLGVTTVGNTARFVQTDGTDVWVANLASNTVSRVRASDGRLLETWTGADFAYGVVVSMGRVFATAALNPGRLYMIDPSQPVGAVTTIASIPNRPLTVATDGAKIWTANENASVSIITPSATLPWPVTTIQTQQANFAGIIFDGNNIWTTCSVNGTLLRFNSDGSTAQTVNLDAHPEHPAFDGTNLWVPCEQPDSVKVVRVSTGAVVATLTGNGLNNPWSAAFDGERILVTNSSGQSVSLWRATDLSPLGSFSIGAFPYGVCSDGLSFWIVLGGFTPDKLARF